MSVQNRRNVLQGNRFTAGHLDSKVAARRRYLQHSVMLAAGAMLLAGASSAFADNMQVWTGTDATNPGYWNTADNWSPAIVPQVGDTVTFGSNVTSTIMDDSGINMMVSQMNFTNTNATTIQATTSEQSVIMANEGAGAGINIASNAGTVTFGILSSTNSGILNFQISGAATFLNSSTNTLTISGASESIASGANASGVLTIDGPGNTVITGYLGNQGTNTIGLVKNGSGTLQLTNNPGAGNTNKWTGGFTINAGEVAVAGGNTFSGAAGGNTIYLNGGGLYVNSTQGRIVPITDGVVFGGDFTFGSTNTGSQALTFNGPVDLGGTARTNTITTIQNTLTFNGGVSDGGFIKAGSATLIISGVATTYSGPTVIDAGTLQVGTGSSSATDYLSPNSAFSISNGATLNLSGYSQIIGSLADSGTNGGGLVTLGNGTAGTLNVGGDNTSTTFSGTLSGAGNNSSSTGLLKTGTGTFSLTGTGLSSVNLGVAIGDTSNDPGGTLSFTADSQLGGTALNINNGTLLANANITSARTIDLNYVNSSIDATGGNTLTLTGALNVSGDLTKGTNAGTVQLAQPSGYTFSGNVNALGGTLAFGITGGSIGPVNVTGALNVANGAVAQFLPSTTAHVLNTVNTLNLNNTGLIDLSNSDLSVNNSLSQVRSYLAQAYAGGAWTGTSGITSSVVEANPSALSIAYVSGANTNNAALNPALTNTSAVLLRPSLIGDFNLDGKVDRFDIRQFNARNAFNDGLTTHDWADGDLNGDGKVDRFDIRILNASNNFNSGNTFVAQAQTLSSSVSPATGNSINNPTTVGTVGDGKPDLIYNPSTGDVVFSYDGYNPGTGKELVEIDVQSSKSDLNPSGANTSAAQFVSKASNDVDYQDVGTGIADGVDLGTIMPVGSTPAALTNGDIVVNLYLNGEGTSNKYADITSTPEPTTLSLMGLAAVGLLGRRRKAKKDRNDVPARR